MTITFTEETYQRREAAVRALMDERGLAALIVYGLGGINNAHVEYLAGPCTRNSIYFCPASGDPVLFVQPKAVVPFAARLARCEVRNGGIDFSTELIDLITAHGLEHSAIGLVEVDSLRLRGIPHLLYLALRDRFPGARLDTVTEAFERITMQLGPEELTLIEQAAIGLDTVIDYFVDQIRPGAVPNDVVAATHAFADETGLLLTSLSCRGAAMDGSTLQTDPVSTTRPLGDGDFIFFESGAHYGKYGAYHGFPIALGDPPPDCQRLFDTARDVALAVTDCLRPGKATSDLARCGEIALERGLWCHGPIAQGMSTGGWQLIALRGFDGYRQPTEITFTEGMAYAVYPHLGLADLSKITILGNVVVVTDDAPRVLDRQGMHYLVK